MYRAGRVACVTLPRAHARRVLAATHTATVATTTSSSSSSSSLSCVALALHMCRRGQYSTSAANSSRRDQEGFLTQYDPLQVLDLPPDCDIADVDEAFAAAQRRYGPKGTTPNASMLTRVTRAHEILKDPTSPYYTKAHTSQTERQRLQFQLLPAPKRRLIQLNASILLSILAAVAVLVVQLCFQPIRRSLRAATR